MGKLIDLNNFPDVRQLKALLSTCMWADDERMEQELEGYRTDKCRRLVGKFLNEVLVGVMGIMHTSDVDVILQHIAVNEVYRGNGYGSSMIAQYVQENGIHTMEAETDKDAVDFYRRIGFQIVSLGEKYAGVERFRCRLEISKQERVEV